MFFTDGEASTAELYRLNAYAKNDPNLFGWGWGACGGGSWEYLLTYPWKYREHDTLLLLFKHT